MFKILSKYVVNCSFLFTLGQIDLLAQKAIVKPIPSPYPHMSEKWKTLFKKKKKTQNETKATANR